jgi:hypothetical protein
MREAETPTQQVGEVADFSLCRNLRVWFPRENFSIVVVGVAAHSHAAAVVRVGASCGQGVGNGVIVVHPCPQLVPTARRAVHSLTLRSLVRSRDDISGKSYHYQLWVA